MKKIITILHFSFLSVIGFNYSQTIPSDFIDAKEVYFYGLGFSSIGAFGDGFKDPNEMITKYFPDMIEYIYKRRTENYLEISFKGDFYYPKKYKSKELIYYTDETHKNISDMNPDKLFYFNALDFRHLSKDSIQTIVNKYIKPENETFGFVIVMEDINKLNSYASAWPTIFNMKTGEIIYTERYEELPGGWELEAGGWGFKHYWMAAIERCIKSFSIIFLKILKQK